jgi:hypothetical protein
MCYEWWACFGLGVSFGVVFIANKEYSYMICSHVFIAGSIIISAIT